MSDAQFKEIFKCSNRNFSPSLLNPRPLWSLVSALLRPLDRSTLITVARNPLR